MRVVAQRVSGAKVTVDGRTVGSIERGLLLLVGVRQGDDDGEVAWMAEKLVHLRIFPDPEYRMNLSVADIDGEILAISQFTLLGEARKGRRPNFEAAAPFEAARILFDRLVAALRTRVRRVETGEFGAVMAVESTNEGPVTLIIDSPSDSGPTGGLT